MAEIRDLLRHPEFEHIDDHLKGAYEEIVREWCRCNDDVQSQSEAYCFQQSKLVPVFWVNVFE